MMKTVQKYLFIPVFILSLAAAAGAQSLRIYHIDVEQADATLIVAPGGKTLLVDSGNNGHGSRIQAIMQKAGVSQIDFFVDTHYHKDHYGGIDDLVNLGITVVKAYDRGDKQYLDPSKHLEDAYTDYETAVGNRAEHLMRGEQIPLDPGMKVICISSGGVVLGEENPVYGKNENDRSISLLIQYKGFIYFIGGDIDKPSEQKIADRDLVMDVDVYRSNHHGSDTSSSPDFMNDMKPSVIIISNGNNKKYQHPCQDTLNFYAGMTPKPIVLQTNKYLKDGKGGNVADEFIADLVSTRKDGNIVLTVDETVQNYTIQYRDKARTFSVKHPQTQDVSMTIESVLPNPVGLDKEAEAVTIHNKGNQAVPLTGFWLEDERGKVWSLSTLGTINAGQSLEILRKGMAMSLNNDGDTISLFGPGNKQYDSFHYDSSAEGVAIQTGH